MPEERYWLTSQNLTDAQVAAIISLEKRSTKMSFALHRARRQFISQLSATSAQQGRQKQRSAAWGWGMSVRALHEVRFRMLLVLAVGMSHSRVLPNNP